MRLPVRALVVLGSASCTLTCARQPTDDPAAYLARVLRDERPLTGRLSSSRQWQACAVDASRSGSVACDGGLSDRALRRAALLAPTLAARPDSHAEALLLLATGGDSLAAVARAVDLLENRLVVHPDAATRNDLAVALLTRSALQDNPTDRLRALELLSAPDTDQPATLFNRALALEALQLRRQAGAAWRTCVERCDGQWRAEAARRAEAMSRATTPTVGPEALRLRVIDTLLVAWAGGAGDTADLLLRADSAARAHAAIAGDATALHAVQAVHDATDRGTIARGVSAYWDGRTAHRADSLAHARLALARASRLLRPWPALAGWAETWLAATEIQADQLASARIRAARAAATAARAGRLALAGRARQAEGLSLSRDTLPAAARAAYEAARRAFERAREPLLAAIMSQRLAELDLLLGNVTEGLRGLVRANDILASRPPRLDLVLGLIILGQSAVDAGLPHAAVALLTEAADHAQAIGHATARAEALARLASASALAGNNHRAREFIDSARIAIARVADGPTRRTIGGELALAEALRRESDTAVISHLSRAMADLDLHRSPLVLYPLLVARGRASAHTGATTAARADYVRAVQMLATHARGQPALVREHIAARQRIALRHLVALELAAGDTAAALVAALHLERRDPSRPPPPRPTTAVVQWVPVEGAMIVLVHGPHPLAHRLTVSPDSLSRLARRFSVLTNGGPASDWHASAAVLGDALFGSVAAHLPDSGALMLLVPPELRDAPLAAVRIGDRFAIDRWALVVGRDADAVLPASAPTPRPLIVAADLIDRRAHPSLAPLTALHGETVELVRLFPAAVVMRGAEATVPAVARTLGRHGLLHFAGHARSDPDDDRESFLVLSPTGDDRGRLDAARIRHADLRGVGLVVLAACETGRSWRGAGVPAGGLATSFLAAGADAVISSLWTLRDQDAAEFSVVLARGLAAGRPAHVALREAQLALRARGRGSWGAYVIEVG